MAFNLFLLAILSMVRLQTYVCRGSTELVSDDNLLSWENILTLLTIPTSYFEMLQNARVSDRDNKRNKKTNKFEVLSYSDI
jgi:hypothetical protein